MLRLILGWLVARTHAGRELTEEHRQLQVRLAERSASRVRVLFRKLIDWRNVEQSAGVFAREAAVVVARNRERSRAASVDYLEAFRKVEAPSSPAPIEEPEEIEVADLARELLVAARASLLAMSKKGYSESDALERAEQVVGAKATKLVADGGRRVIENEVRRGNGPVGYARVPDADPCPFCAMLASRGVYYGGDETPGALLYRSDAFEGSNARFVGDGEFKVHDGCCCGLEPVYMRGGKVELPGEGNRLAREWAEVAAGQPDPWGAWRRWRDSRTLPEDYEGDLEGVRRPAPGSRQRGPADRVVVRQTAPREKDRFTSAQDYHDYADELSKRVNGIDDEIAQLKMRGQTDEDVPVMALQHKKRLLLSHIDKYRSKARMM